MGERTNQLRLSEVKQQLLLDSISDPILALSGNLTVLYCNDFYGKLAGKTTKELVGTNLEVRCLTGAGTGCEICFPKRSMRNPLRRVRGPWGAAIST